MPCRYAFSYLRSAEAPEVLLELLIHQVLDAVVGGILLSLHLQLEPDAAATLLNDTAADIGGHDDEGVLEVDNTTLDQKGNMSNHLQAESNIYALPLVHAMML